MKLIVEDMSCQHCVKTITQAINQVDPNAIVTIDLTKKVVDIQGVTISQQAIIAAIDDAGFEVTDANN